jgi:mannan endo-1,4-beta-mannosidase
LPLLVAAVLIGCVGVAAVALAAPASSRPQGVVSVTVPGEVVSGAEFVVAGRTSDLGTSGRVVVQVESAGGWKTLGRGRVSARRFKVPTALPGEGTVSLRAVVSIAGHPPTRSAPRRVMIKSAPSAPGASPSPPVTSPSAAATSGPTPNSAPSSPEPVPPATPEPPATPPTSSDYWGAWIGPQFTGTPAPQDMNAVSDFEALSGKPLSLLETYSPWAVCPGSSCAPNQAFPAAELEKIRSYGAVPMFSWASERNGEVDEPEYQLADIIAGTYDSYIRTWATEAKAWGHPFFLRFDWEMNGNWFPWGKGVNGNQEGEYVAAWQHVHKIFAEVGATNASWVWCPYVDPNGGAALQSSALYPGDEYVDWTGLDGYNKGTAKSVPWRTFAYLFGPDYREITETLAPSKPMLIAEVASSESGGSKGAWIEEMFAQIPAAFPKVRGLMWFDYIDQENDWPIETSPTATAAFAGGISDPRYLTNSLGSLPDGPVPVP